MGSAGTGPFSITGVVPRQSVTLSRNDDYWDPAKKAKVDQILLLPIPEANTRLAALRSGQGRLDRSAAARRHSVAQAGGFRDFDRLLPACLAVVLQHGRQGQPGRRTCACARRSNYCIDRNAIVTLLNGTAEPSVGWLKADDPGVRQAREPLHVRSGQGQEAAGRGGLHRQEAALLQGHDLDLGLGPDAAAADERGAAGEPQAGLQRRRAGRGRSNGRCC